MSAAEDPETCRRRADALLAEAAAATNLAERGRLIDEAARWHFKALGDDGRQTRPELDPATEALWNLEDPPPDADTL